jgi:hypothetical protein
MVYLAGVCNAESEHEGVTAHDEHVAKGLHCRLLEHLTLCGMGIQHLREPKLHIVGLPTMASTWMVYYVAGVYHRQTRGALLLLSICLGPRTQERLRL